MPFEYPSMYKGTRVIHTPNGSYLVGLNASAYQDNELIPLIGLNETAIRISDSPNNPNIDSIKIENILKRLMPSIITDDKSDKVSRSLESKIIPDEHSGV
jgi:hypothetical protein